MAKGPILGTRIPVKLPWKGATNNEEQFVSMKAPVAQFLGFNKANQNDLLYEVEIKKLDKPGEKVQGTTKIKRRRRPGYRQRSVKIYFGDPKTGKSVTKKIGSKQVKSVQFPITTSVIINEVIEYFETGGGKNLQVVKVVDANSGQGYPVIQN